MPVRARKSFCAPLSVPHSCLRNKGHWDESKRVTAPALVDQLFKALQSECSPALWSEGVTLTRGGNSFVGAKQTDEEVIVHVRVKTRPVSHKVTLWPKEKDWDCDCGDPDMPCAHIVAATIALKRGVLAFEAPAAPVGAAGTSTVAPAGFYEIHYDFRRTPEGLRLERFFVGGGERKAIEIPLASYKGGLQSGRLKGLDVLASKADYAVERALAGYRTAHPLERSRLELLFKVFESDQKIFLDGQPVAISTDLLHARLEILDEGDGYRLRRVKNPTVTEHFRHGAALCTDTLKLLAPTGLTPEEMKLVSGEGTYFGPEQEDGLCGRILPALRKKLPLDINSLKLPQALELPPHARLILEKDRTPQGEACLSILAKLLYGDPPLAELNPQTMQLVPMRDRLTSRITQVVRRDPDAEKKLLQRLSQELNLQIGRRVQLTGRAAVDFTYKLNDWEFTGDGFAAFHPTGRELAASVQVTEGAGVSFEVRFLTPGGQASSAAEFETVFKAWQAGSDDVPLLDGTWAKVPKGWMAEHGRKVREFLAAREAGRKDVPAPRLPELAALCEELGAPCPPSIANLRTLLGDFRGIRDARLPVDLTADLRNYQREGVNWLSFLRDAGLGALLADDMGLGKTLQTICVLQGRSLIVAPTSVIFNWAKEIQKFRPGLSLSLYYGSKRELDGKANVILTSYGVLRMDQERLAAETWDAAVLDEAQTIKNPDSQVARAAHALKARFRVALSGTPVENRLDDLWSQFRFVNPGLLEGREDFLENFARPIARGEQDRAIRLRSRIKPFVLRRLKKDVAKDLPARTETVLNCELTPDERTTYESILAATKAEALADLEAGGSVLKILEVILRLRQACCHSALLPGNKASSSSKTDLLMDTLEESLSEGHKNLVFSQWTSYLDLIAAELDKRGIRYSRIDGSTQDRQALVDEFQGSDGPPVMLLSLKAGGVGLTLTAADHVFIVDPWWNPAVEDQAADRAHRIGQQNPVVIHRLVARETIEERILALQEKKKDLARAVLDGGGAALGLTRADILELLA